MQLDRNMLDRLLAMNDAQLGEAVKRIAKEAGIDPAQLGISTESIQSVRDALGGASAEDVARMNAIYQAYRDNRKRS